MIIHIVLGSLCGIVTLFCLYTCCCKKKRNPYAEFEDHPQRDEIAKQSRGGAINESFKDDLYNFEQVDVEKDREYSKKKSPNTKFNQDAYLDNDINSASKNLQLDV